MPQGDRLRKGVKWEKHKPRGGTPVRAVEPLGFTGAGPLALEFL